MYIFIPANTSSSSQIIGMGTDKEESSVSWLSNK